LQEQGDNSTPESRKGVSRHLREVLGKGWTLTGIPRACDAHFSLSEIEGEDANLMTSNREKIVEGANGKEMALARTDEWFKNVFTGADHTRIWASTSTNMDLSTWCSLLMFLLLALFISVYLLGVNCSCIIIVLTNYAFFFHSIHNQIYRLRLVLV